MNHLCLLLDKQLKVLKQYHCNHCILVLPVEFTKTALDQSTKPQLEVKDAVDVLQEVHGHDKTEFDAFT